MSERESATTRETVGELLKRLRREARLGLVELADRARVSEKHLQALEADDWRLLPEPVYQRSFLKAVATALGVDSGPLLAVHASALASGVSAGEALAPPRAPARRAFWVTPRLWSALLVTAAALAVCVALIFEVWRIVSPPLLTLASPVDNERVAAPIILLEGRTEPEAELRLNGERVYPRSDGLWSASVNLHLGVNVIKISAKKPHSDERVVYRRLFRENAVSE